MKEAYQQFQKRVKHEQEVVQKATLSAVGSIMADTEIIYKDVQSTSHATQRLEEGMSSVLNGTERMTRYIDGKSALAHITKSGAALVSSSAGPTG